jgi:hypothetical protein
MVEISSLLMDQPVRICGIASNGNVLVPSGGLVLSLDPSSSLAWIFAQRPGHAREVISMAHVVSMVVDIDSLRQDRASRAKKPVVKS